MGLMGMASTAGLNALAHSVTFGINLAVFTNLLQYMYTRRKRKPFYCVLVATVCIMGDLVRHLINDAVNWELVNEGNGEKFKFDFTDCAYPVHPVGAAQCKAAQQSAALLVSTENALGLDLSMYNQDGSLSVYGWIFTIGGTWTGFAFLFIGVLWYADLGAKLRAQFAQLRGRTIDTANQVTEAFLTPVREDAELDGFLTPVTDPGSPIA